MSFPRLFRRRNAIDIDQIGTHQVQLFRYPMTGPGRTLEVTRGPSLDEWRRRIRTHNDSRRQWSQLERTLGWLYAELFIDLVADQEVLVHGGSLDALPPAAMAVYIQNELDRFRSRRRHVDWLMMRTVTGHLGTLLNGSIRPTADYYRNAQPGLQGRDLAIDQAANWICGSYAPALPLTRQLLNHYIPVAPGHPGIMGDQALGPTEKHLRDIHLQVASDSNRFRLGKEAPYPSSLGGSKLLSYIFQLSAGTNWPAFGSPRWDSIAMFYLASIVHVQGFGDGNKRAGHFAYSIVMIKNTHSFKAPSAALERWLTRMDR